ncbi:hypothetical protein KP509_02G088200 [Ceratopteris richardii]|uniref:Uncharacterized protein n=1 Tax=Ceratopteris richardii TaxID=49495 RepID=A0A8T2VBW3_CERRI|nr:hypothetical protein KP509_02G088200 [Ceratopteris richardii]
MGSTAAVCGHITLTDGMGGMSPSHICSKGYLCNRIFYGNSVNKNGIRWVVHSSKSFQVFSKLRKGGKSGNNGDNKSYGNPFSKGGSSLRCPVPLEQQPVNEYQSLVDSMLFSWAVGNPWLYTLKLSAVTGAIGLFAATLAALRMYLGWAYVGNRLLSAAVEYEETGWYDGEIWIKPPEVLARDRLLGSYKVKPALNRVKMTLIGLAASLASCTLLFLSLDRHVDVPPAQEDTITSSGPSIGTPYNEASALTYEPDAFGDAGESMLPDYCH